MKILVTGSKGFIGRNLVETLKCNNEHEVFEFDKDTDAMVLNRYCKSCDFIFHLAGVNRPMDNAEFMEGNFDLTRMLLDNLKHHENKCPIVLSSSIQAELNNPYGESKKAGEDLIFKYGSETGAKVFVYRFPNVFGKWSRPNYNSSVATFCHNISRDLPIQVNDPSTILNLAYIDDVVNQLIENLSAQEIKDKEFCKLKTTYKITLGDLVDLLYSFKASRDERCILDMSDPLVKKLYSTYLSFLPLDNFGYDLKMNIDSRGSFTEFLRTPDRGQVSVNISKPGIVKGNHWHHTKNEKFLVVSGEGVIRFRNIVSGEVVEYHVSEEKLTVVDIPTGYTHNIENLGTKDMVTIMWANEAFDPNNPDTYFLEV